MLGQGVWTMYGSSAGRRDRDVVTPHNVSILLFIQKYALFRPNKYWDHRPPDPNTPHPDLTPQERKATCLMTVRLIQGGDMTLSEVLKVLETAPLLPLHVSSFMTALHQMYRSGIDSLLNLFDSVEKFAVQDSGRSESFPCLWTSVVGLYLRRLNLTFRRLSFSQVTSLYQSFQLYYQDCFTTHQPPTLPLQQDQMATEDSNIADDTDSDAKMEDVVEERREEEDDDDQEEAGESAINLTVCSAEVMAISNNRGVRRGGEEDDDEAIMQPPVLLSRDSDKKRTLREAGHSSRQQAELFISQQTSLLQYSDTAALPPPILQAKIKQLVKQNPDMAEAHFLSYLNCLRAREYFGALHSLLRAFDGHPGRNGDTGRSGDVGRSGEDTGRAFRYAAMNLAALHAQFGHQEAGLEVLREAVRLAQESSDHTCLQHCLAWLYTLSPLHKAQLMQRSVVKSSELSLSYLSCLGRLGHAAELSHTTASPASLLQNVTHGEGVTWQHSLVSLQHGGWGLRAALWCCWGAPVMAALASQLLLRLNSRHPATNITASSKTTANTFYAGQPTCAAVCNVAIALANLGEYQHAGEILRHAQLRFPANGLHAHTWMFARAHVSLTDHLHTASWTRAHSALTNMASTQPIEARLRRSDLLVATGDLVGAWRLLGELRNESAVADGEARVRLLLAESCVAVTAGGWAIAIPILVEALTVATRHHLAYLAALTHLHTANVQMHLGLMREAEASMAAGLSGVLAGGSVYDQACARLLHSKLAVSQAKGKQTGKLLEVALSLDLVRQLFTKVRAFHRVRETIYIKARLYHEVGYVEERNKCALEFRQFELNHPCQAYQRSMKNF
ncbi:hypothetical protein Pcinc_019879 [Petrolisthes cinctipes]|uniref:Anaphase-promoting complex subunit 5 n=1 Tax=Petrolisthes cinctipes TaxID=88211 RepID=A0AAE1FLA6_PETCI|nr:hypothetical protein Pcinc_019879 [Petrolisthes cinctipes]